ncbi:DUF547 domain-containing protein [Erythrobacter rubeus]|uniref:DUF547 domain-containing protein n=1 Tax=Erythrobacter rubeus TaxID=2760803 RepID=A0ABR8KTH9_9SPHN|nr:DUF547 domain-containing protein [Erythrobacter rubeus]MBD2842737.1 DUF547 domain-containing protein [Erythrobacter rubeus]
MKPDHLSPSLAVPTMSRRTMVAAIPATALLAACGAPSSGGLGDDSFASNDASTDTIDHSAWDALLKQYVVKGQNGVNLVEYEKLKTEAGDTLASYLQAMQAVAIDDYGRDEQFAFWVNLYNAATVDVILKNLPLDSIRDIGLLRSGPWKDDAVTVAGRTLSLDNIEHDILRPEWQDPRIHYAVNCASIGCPNLAAEAYTADKLEEMLEAAAVDYVNHPRGFGGQPGQLIASSIYDWYQVDWGSPQGVLDHARTYARGPTMELLDGAETIDGYDYDWSLNDA